MVFQLNSIGFNANKKHDSFESCFFYSYTFVGMYDTIETERLILRKFTLDDAEAAFEMNNDPEVMKYIPGEISKSVEDVRENIRKNTIEDYEKYGFGRSAIILKETNEFIGFTGLKNDLDIGGVDLGYRLIRRFWGKGYATESARPFIKIAFEDLAVKTLWGGAMAENLASISILKKMGMSYRHTEVFEGLNFDMYAIDDQKYNTIKDY